MNTRQFVNSHIIEGTLLKVVNCGVTQDKQSIYFDLDRSGVDSAVKVIYLAFSPIAQSSYGRAVYLQSASGIVSTRITMASTPVGYASFNSQEWTKPEASNCPFYSPAPVGVLPPIPLSALPFRAYEAYLMLLVVTFVITRLLLMVNRNTISMCRL